MEIPVLDLQAQYRAIQGEIDAAIQGVLDSGRFTMHTIWDDWWNALENKVWK